VKALTASLLALQAQTQQAIGILAQNCDNLNARLIQLEKLHPAAPALPPVLSGPKLN
jgi:hypothetical protein